MATTNHDALTRAGSALAYPVASDAGCAGIPLRGRSVLSYGNLGPRIASSSWFWSDLTLRAQALLLFAVCLAVGSFHHFRTLAAGRGRRKSSPRARRIRRCSFLLLLFLSLGFATAVAPGRCSFVLALGMLLGCSAS